MTPTSRREPVGGGLRCPGRRWLLAPVLATVLAFLSVELAAACSCAIGGTARERLQYADAAFVGVVTARRSEPVADDQRSSGALLELDFRVERAFKGALGPQVTVRTSVGGASCGFDAQPGDRLALYLWRGDNGVYASNGCSIADPLELAKGATPLPRPSGRGPVRFLMSGSFGEPAVIALDRHGRTLAYGQGSGTSIDDLQACPGGRRALETTYVDGVRRLYVRDLRSMRVRRRVSLPGEPLAVACRAPNAHEIVALVSHVDGTRNWSSRLLRISPRGTRVLQSGSAHDASIGRRYAWLGGDYATSRLTRVDLRTGRAQRVARLDGSPTALASPDGERAAFQAEDGRLCVAGGPAAIAVSSERMGLLTWADDRTLVARAHAKANLPVRVLDARLRPVRALPGLDKASVVAGAAGRIYAIADDRLLTVRARSGPVRQLGRVTPGASELVTVDGDTRISRRARSAAAAPRSR